MPSLDAVVIWLDSGVCSQNPAHSFWIGGQPLPLCARDLGLFGGFLLASSIFTRARVRPTLPCTLGLAPLALDGLNSLASDAFGLAIYPPNNCLRLITGLLAGLSLALLVHRASLSIEGRGQTSIRHSVRRAKNLRPVHALRNHSLSLAGRGLGTGFSLVLNKLAARLPTDRFRLIWVVLGALAITNPHLGIAVIVTGGILALLAAANRLTHPLTEHFAWTLALPELAVLAAVKQVALLALR